MFLLAVALIVLGERTTRVTFSCSAVALTGVALMFGGSDLVWIRFAETPSPVTIAGGLTVIAAVVLTCCFRFPVRRAGVAKA